MPWQDRIEQRPAVLLGKPVIKGTRLTVQLIVEALADGMSEVELLKVYPRLKAEDVRAALAYAAASLASDELVPLAEPMR